MNRISRPDAELNALNEERDHLAIQISLAADAPTPQRERLLSLRNQLAMVERRISNYRPTDA